MSRLRVRDGLAVTFALGLLVGAWTFRPGGGTGSSSVAEESAPDRASAALEADEPAENQLETGASVDRLPLTDGAEGQPGEPLEAETDRPPGPVAPLTGLPVDAAGRDRPALVVKVDNHPRARPQTGLDQADIVFDLRAEGITRFAAVFQSQIPDPVGPVRSSRTSDFDLLRGFDNPLYASSGGNDYVTQGLRSLPIVELTNRTRNEYFRDFARPAPHNLFVNGSDLYALAPDDLPVPEPWFGYREPGQALPPSATEAIGPVSVSFTGSPLVTHQWDESVGGWLRAQDGAPHLTVEGDQLAPENVVIMITDYGTSPADPISPEVRSTGSGPAYVLTDGHIVVGRWERPAADDKPVLTAVDGHPVALTPGRTWVLMPEEGQVRFAAGQPIGDGT